MPDHRTQSRRRIDRVQLACAPCRAGKLKCNRELPACDQCQKRSREDECNYTERGLRYNTANRDFESMREKLDRLENFVSRLKESNTILPPAASAEAESSKSKAIQNASTDVTGPTGSLKYEDDTTFYIGPAHWEALIEDLTDVKAYFKREGESSKNIETPESAIASSSYVSSSDIAMGVSGTYTRQDLLRLLPSRAEMDRLISTWFTSVDGLRTLLHTPSFQLKYAQFWQDHTVVSNTWLACLFAVASLGAEIAGQNRADPDLLVQAENFRRIVGYALVLAEYTKIQPRTVQTILLLIQSRMLRSHDVDNETWVLMGVACRLGLRQGYHRDPSIIVGTMPPFVYEMKRRAWLHLRQLDIHVAYKFGLTSTMHSVSTDTKLPLNFLDSDFTSDYIPPSSRPAEECTPNLYTVHHAQLTFTFGRIIASAHALNPQSQAEIAALSEELQEWEKACPRILRPAPLESTILDSPELVFARIKLELLRIKCVIVLYRRYLGKQEFKNEAERCIGAAIDSVKLHTVFVEASEPGERLEDCRPFIALYVHDFNLAAMVLCWHLRRSSSGIEEAQNQESILELLSKGCYLWLKRGVKSARATQALSAIISFMQQMRQPVGAELPSFSDQINMPMASDNSSINQADFMDHGFEDWLGTQHGLFDDLFLGPGKLDDPNLDFTNSDP